MGIIVGIVVPVVIPPVVWIPPVAIVWPYRPIPWAIPSIGPIVWIIHPSKWS